MKSAPLFALALLSLLALSQAQAAEPAAANIPTQGKTNTVCPITGKPVNSAITFEYEGLTWSFADSDSRAAFKAARENSLYQKLGGKPAINAAVDAFYVKVLADARVNSLFADINMNRQRHKQKEFLAAAFGGPIPWTGKDLRRIHAGLHLTEAHFNAIAEDLKSTLEDLKIKKDLIDQVLAIVGSVKDKVLNHPTASK